MTNKALEVIAREINPLRDFENITFLRVGPIKDNSQALQALGSNIYNAIAPLPKHLLRGGVIGGATGAVVSLFTGDSPYEFARYGAGIGLTIDGLSFIGRAAFLYYSSK